MRLPVMSVLAALVHTTACSAANGTGDVALFSATPLTFPVGENAIHLVDLDGDGALDLISASEARGELSIRLGDGTGGFATPTSHSVGNSPTSLDSADFDSDGRLDLVIANHEQRYLTVAFGDGAGGVARTERILLPDELAPHAHMVRVADIDGNSAPDLVVDSRDRFGAFVLLGQPGGLRFRAIPVEVSGAPYLGFAIGDFDADSATDLATPNANDVSLLRNERDAAGRFALVQRLPIRSPFSVAFADIDGDGRLDLLAASEDGQTGLAIFHNEGSGSFAPAPSTRHELASGAKNLAVADVDGDGRPDVIATAWGGDIAVVFGGRADRPVARPPRGRLTAPWSIAVGDVNGDGKDEFVVVDGISGQAVLYSWRGSDPD